MASVDIGNNNQVSVTVPHLGNSFCVISEVRCNDFLMFKMEQEFPKHYLKVTSDRIKKNVFLLLIG